MAGLSKWAPARRRLVLVAATVACLLAALLPSAVVIAATAPNTIIASSPASFTTATSASFTFSSTKSGSSFACKLDASAWGACTSPKAYSSLAQASHTFSVRATWKGATDPSPATWTWTIDTTAPGVPTNLAGTSPTASSVKLTWTAASDNVGVTGYDVYRGGAPLAGVGGAVLTYTDATVSAGLTYSYAIRAHDAAGNASALTSPVSVTVPIPPETIIDTALPAGTNSTSATIAFHSDKVGATFTCKLDTLAAAACTSPKGYTGLAQGVHTFTVYATLNGIADPTPATATWTVDTTAPTAPTGLGASSLSSTSVQLTWTAATDNLGVTGYKVFRDGSLLATIGSVTTHTDATVPDGTFPAYALQAFDIAGNVSPLTAPVSAPRPLLPFDPALTRMPYLTDLVGLNATVNFATDRSGGAASVQFGPVAAGVCSLTATVPATRITISLGADAFGSTIWEYQWKAALTLPATGSYCYRAYLGAADLLGSNPAPVFQAQVPVGSTEPYTFAVFGDWGQTDANGANPYQAGVMSQIAASGARFAITTGDQGYPSGTQADFGDIIQPLSGIFGMPFWGGVGSDLAIFPIIGNHGFANNSAEHPHFANWPQDTAVATSAGQAQMSPYGAVNGSLPANYPDSWYAFSAGNARFYMLTATWPDGNVGTGGVYWNDYLAHWTTSSPEYQWLQADLAAHPSGLKFAFFHYPLYSDQPSESGDTYLQGNSSLEGLLASSGVNIAFNGHAHIYERNAAAGGRGRLGLVSYVTGGGGGQAQSTGTCGTLDRYAVGWSYTNSLGTACGTAPIPTSPAQVHHFLKVTISGSAVTVTPTDSTGRTFDVQTYNFAPKPDTFIDGGPAAGTTDTNATFAFHASSASATYTCRLDGGTAGSCTSPKSYSGLAEGSHTFAVYATVGGVADPLPATWTWTVDATPPTAPTGFAASPTSPFSVALTWTAATDNIGVTGYDVFRDDLLLVTIAPATSYTDSAVLGGSTHSYAVRARDVAGNLSAFTPTIGVTTPPPPAPVWADGFESGDLSAWGSNVGLAVQGTDVHGGAYAAEGNTTAVGPYAKKTLPDTYADAYARTWFLVKSQASQVNLLRMRDAAGGPIGYVYIETTGQLGFHNDGIGASGTNFLSATVPAPGWHALELHILSGGSGGAVDVWLDNVRIADLSGPTTTTVAPIGAIQVGEAQTTSQVYDVVFDDVAFGTSHLGPVADAAPSVPAGLTATATSAFSVDLAWSASSDDLGVAGYDVFRDGTLIATLGAITSWTDTTVLASTDYNYAVRARDTSGNRSALSNPAVPVTTPAVPAPIFADGFESGDLTAWTSSAGLTVESTDVRSGTYAAEGVGAANVKKILPAAYAGAYSRVAFIVKSFGTQFSLIRLRDAAGTSIGYVYLSNTGRIGFRNDVGAGASYTSTTVPGPGWHAIELHLGIAGASSPFQVWLDGNLVGNLPTSVDLGASGPIGQFQVGDTVGGTNDIVYDDAAFGTSRLGPSGDTIAPTVPAGLSATPAPFSVALTWAPSTDDVAVAGYDVYRDTVLVANLVNTTGYSDTTVLASTTYQYTVRARDTSGNPSAQTSPLSVTTLAPLPPVFADGFESGDLTAWTSKGGLTVESTDTHASTYAVEGTNAAYVKKTLPATYVDAYARTWFEVKAPGGQLSLLRLRSAIDASIGQVFISSSGKLGFKNDVSTVSTTSAVTPAAGWHALELHLGIAIGTVEVWLDGGLVSALSSTGANLGVDPAAVLQVGDSAIVTTPYDVVYDDAAFGTTRLGPVADAPPSVPADLAATTPLPMSVVLTWTASTDDIGIAGYDVVRDGAPLASLGDVATYTDTVGAGSTHNYAIRARDTSGNRSALTAPVPATTPTDAPPTIPTSVDATAGTAYAIDVTWHASTDDVGVVGYDVYRDGALLASLGNVLAYTDVAVRTGSTYEYTVAARDGAGNMSALSTAASVTTPAATTPIFADGFESGDLSIWTTKNGLDAEQTTVHSGAWAVEGVATSTSAYAKKTLPATFSDGYARVWFNVKAQSSQLNLLRLRDGTASFASIGYLYLASSTGVLGFHNDTGGGNTLSGLVPGPGWHALELHFLLNGASSTVEVWLDGAPVPSLSTSLANLGSFVSVGQIQVGETASGTYDVVYDDAAFGTARIGL